MSEFEQYLQSIGYKPFKVMFTGKKSNKACIYIPLSDMEIGYFSTMIEGRITNHWRKDDNEIVWGLHEKDKPPTLINPKPVGITHDDEMNRMLKEHSPEEIYNMLNL